MKIIDRRCGWFAVGTEVARIPANKEPTPDEMLAYYGLRPEDEKYEVLGSAAKYERIVLKKPFGNFLIVPLNPDVYVLEY